MINKADITTIYISIPIFYPSGSLHLGHALTSTMADVTARWCKLLGYTVYFTAGVDEHGGKIAKKALSQQMSPVDYVAMMADHFKLFFKQLNINYDHFTRTTDQTHVNVVNDVITQFLKHDYFYKGIYEGNYCVTCEEFLVNQQINHYLPVKQCMTCLSDIS